MRAVLFILWAGLAVAQAGPDGLPLLRAVAESFRGLSSYRAEGHISQDLDVDFGMPLQMGFRVAKRSPQRLRIEVSGGPEWMTGLPLLAVCDGANGWAFFEKGKAYRKVTAGDWTQGYCPGRSLASNTLPTTSVPRRSREQVKSSSRAAPNRASWWKLDIGWSRM